LLQTELVQGLRGIEARQEAPARTNQPVVRPTRGVRLESNGDALCLVLNLGLVELGGCQCRFQANTIVFRLMVSLDAFVVLSSGGVKSVGLIRRGDQRGGIETVDFREWLASTTSESAHTVNTSALPTRQAPGRPNRLAGRRGPPDKDRHNPDGNHHPRATPHTANQPASNTVKQCDAGQVVPLSLRLNLESGGFDGWVALAWSAA
jgi:hypothetical protein